MAGALTATPFACGGRGGGGSGGANAPLPSTLEALMADGDPSAVAPGAMAPASTVAPPPRFCTTTDCARDPLAFWRFDDCNAQSTQLADTAFTSSTSHPAFRAVSVACVAGIDAEAVRLAGGDDIVYAPDQPDFTFTQGLTIAAWIKPDRLAGTQSLVRKRLDGTSAFVLALDGKRLTFALALASGRLVNVTAPIAAGAFTHVAATYDGEDAKLYVNGAVAGTVHAAGRIAAGAGPIFIGNDANGRQFKGIVDDVWLNTAAAPADVIAGLTCIRQPPVVALAPTATAAQTAGTSVAFDLSVTNQNSGSCPVDSFEYLAELSFPLTTDAFEGVVAVAPGQTVHATVDVRSLKSASVGSYPVVYEVFSLAPTASGAAATAQATYVVGTGPISCDGSPPAIPGITGTFGGPTGGPFTFAATGLIPPNVNAVPASDGSIEALQVALSPGTPTDPANNFLGEGLFFAAPSCVDASAFTGVTFTISGDLGSCPLVLQLNTGEDEQVQFGGVCPNGAACFGPMSGPLTAGTTTVHFADMAGGSPMAAVDPTSIMGVQWLTLLSVDPSAPPCVANFTISDVAFVAD
jgi:hypothetical protein